MITDAVIAELRESISTRLALSRAERDVIAERRRHISGEGWTPEHDDKYEHGELARAAASYAIPMLAHHIWPWSRSWWKPTDMRRNLVKAASLLIAEIDRIDRKADRALMTERSRWLRKRCRDD